MDKPPEARNDGEVNFYRVNDNFGYVKGKISFSNNCSNNLVVSDKSENMIYDLSNSFVIINKGNKETYPIENLQKSYEKVINFLKGEKIKYNIPEKVFKRENLIRKNQENLEHILLDSYGFYPENIKEIPGRVKNNGLFQISYGNKKNILKYFGENKGRIKAISEITKNLYPLFPRIQKTKKGEPYVLLEDGLYILKEFVFGEVNPERDLKYFRKLGETSAFMHEELLKLMKENPNWGKELLSDTKYLSESNLLSLIIDLNFAGFGEISSEIGKFNELKNEISSLPEYFIHGDLNGSNVIDTPEGLRFIDLERIKSSKRIMELESSLLFGGNMEIPIYLNGSLKSFIEGYNVVSSNPIDDNEKGLSTGLLKYSLLKNFVVRNIRRGEKENTKKNLLKNISLLDRKAF